eukprot:SAG25_NODE_14019_length_260_cov_0.633540_1_plen_21_part_10
MEKVITAAAFFLVILISQVSV